MGSRRIRDVKLESKFDIDMGPEVAKLDELTCSDFRDLAMTAETRN
jgi:hypothetical protein